jgi:hypothetical protein
LAEKAMRAESGEKTAPLSPPLVEVSEAAHALHEPDILVGDGPLLGEQTRGEEENDRYGSLHDRHDSEDRGRLRAGRGLRGRPTMGYDM